MVGCIMMAVDGANTLLNTSRGHFGVGATESNNKQLQWNLFALHLDIRDENILIENIFDAFGNRNARKEWKIER